jgi:cell division protein FtsB
MTDFRKRQRIKRVVFSRITIAILAVIVLVLARGVWGIYQKERDTAVKLAQVAREESELEARKMFLESEVARLRTSQGVEEEIRENFGLGTEGEGVIIVVPGDASAAANAVGQRGFWNWIRNFFGRD